MKSQGLNHSMLIRLGPMLLVALVACVIGSTFLIGARFDAIEGNLARLRLEQVGAALQQEQAAFESSVRNYAHWDDTYAFVRDRDESYLNLNYSREIADNLDIDWVVLIGLQGELLDALDLHDAKTGTASEPKAITSIMRVERTVFRRRNKPFASSWQWIEGRLTLIGRSSISDTTGKQPANGWLLFGRELDAIALARLTRLTKVPFEIEPATAGDPIAVARGIGDTWVGSSVLGDMPLRISVTWPATLAAERGAIGLVLLITVCLFSLLTLVSVGWLLRQRVTTRLQDFAGIVERRRVDGDEELRWPVQGNDEIDRLGLALNALVDEVASHQGSLTLLAMHDALTGLGNRRYLMEQLGVVVAARNVSPPSTCLVLLDIDGFKLVNDGLGHAAGDHVLCEFGARIARTIRQDDIGSRLGGDEFAVLLFAVDTTQACMFCEKLRHMLGAPVLFEGRSIALGVSIGVAALTPQLTPQDWLRNADLAMYEAKRIGKNRTVVFRDAMQDSATQTMQLGQALRKVIEARALEVWFQPVVDGRNGVVLGAEALVRWKHEGEYVSPIRFIHIAEEAGLIVRLGQFVLAATCAMLHRLRQKHPRMCCSINLSVRQFFEGDLERDIVAAIEAYGLPTDALSLEITESQVASHESEVVPKMQALVARGFSFSLDDFGTGYSSLDRLRLLPIQTLKIDRSFVKPLEHADDAMVRNIINLARDLGLATIAEGVESEHEAKRLIAMGCHAIQGYLLAKPMPEPELALWMEHRIAR